MRNATRILISTFGGLTGLMGVEHGLGEILQGSAAPSDLIFPSWPDSAFFAALGGEPAMSIIPNLRLTGILAVLISLTYAAWAVFFVQRRRTRLVMLLLCVPMLLFGGGIFPPVLGAIIGAAAGLIHAPLTWWRSHLSEGARQVLGSLWVWLFAACLMSWLGMFPGIPALDYFYGVQNDGLIFALLAGMFGFLLLAGMTGLAKDVQSSQAKKHG